MWPLEVEGCVPPEISPFSFLPWSIIELGGHHSVTPPRLYVTSAGLTSTAGTLQNLFQKVLSNMSFLVSQQLLPFSTNNIKYFPIKMIFLYKEQE